MERGDEWCMTEIADKENILVIDDDESICRTLQMILKASGYYTEYVHTGEKAVESLMSKSFTVALLDIRLPDVIGTNLISKLLEISPNTALIMITGHASVKSAVDALKLGASAYITKPLDMDEVLKTISNEIERQKLIVERKSALESLRKNEMWFRNIFNDSPIAINVFDREGNFINANQACLDFAGVAEVRDLEGFNIFDDPNLSEEMKCKLKHGEVLIFESSIDFKIIRELNLYKSKRLDIAYVESAISPLVFDDTSEIHGYMVQIIDVTKKKLAEQDMMEERDKAKLYLDTAGVMFVALDENANITLINRRGCEILQTTSAETLGKNWISNFIPKRFREEIYDIFNSNIASNDASVTEFENPILTSTGEERIIHWSNTPLINTESNQSHGIFSSGIDVTERRQAEAALRRSEERFKRVFEQSPIGIEILDENGRVVGVNPAALVIFGASEVEQLIGFEVFTDPNTPAVVKECIRKRQPYRFESTFSFNHVIENRLYETAKSGIIYLDTVVTPLAQIDDEQITGTMIQFQDVTEQKLADVALRESEEQWRSYTEESPDHITILDCDFNILFVNRPSEGLLIDDLIGKCILDFLPDEQVEYVRDILLKILETRNSASYETSYDTPSSSRIFYETKAIPRISDNEIVGIMLSSRDITDRKLKEEKIRYQANLLQNISDAVISTDMKFKIISWNSAAEKMYGWKAEEAIGQNITQILPNEYSEISLIEVVEELKEKGAWNGQIIQTRIDGLKLNVLSAMSYILDASGNRIGIVHVNRDITDRIDSLRNLQSERDTSMLYLDIMSHDIRNKLQAIIMGLEIIETELNRSERGDLFTDVQNAADQCSRIIYSIKRTEKLSEVELAPINVSQVVLETIENLFGDREDITIEITNSSNGAEILGDHFLKELTTSLLENAIGYNNQANKIVWVNIENKNGSVLLSVSDNGPGIPDDRKKFLFDKSRRYGGVGLHQVKHIVDKYSGNITIRDRVAGVQSAGVTFELSFPLFQQTNR